MYKSDAETEEGAFVKEIREHAKNALTSRGFITYVLYQFIARGSFMIYFTTFLYIADYVLGLNGPEATIVDVVPGLSIFLVVPSLGKLSKKIGLKKSALYAAVPLAFSFVSGSETQSARAMMGIRIGGGRALRLQHHRSDSALILAHYFEEGAGAVGVFRESAPGKRAAFRRGAFIALEDSYGICVLPAAASTPLWADVVTPARLHQSACGTSQRSCGTTAPKGFRL